MLENLIWGMFIAIPALFVIAAIAATMHTNRDFDLDEEV